MNDKADATPAPVLLRDGSHELLRATRAAYEAARAAKETNDIVEALEATASDTECALSHHTIGVLRTWQRRIADKRDSAYVHAKAAAVYASAITGDASPVKRATMADEAERLAQLARDCAATALMASGHATVGSHDEVKP